ncbi:Pituitary tumor-transforming protein 1 protein-interacting protein [Myotis davidii]|uniref:Pituitary tumor-transforming protein 1 protein-interacting protein n=1 Tax=Myotis davidii TaxID=225400 RepID=L5M640_MYODS|nr:Pituitary tumor-transforming protein 1 protein-interacting protein [Myotis davidii]
MFVGHFDPCGSCRDSDFPSKESLLSMGMCPIVSMWLLQKQLELVWGMQSMEPTVGQVALRASSMAVNFEALIIAMSVVGGLILLAVATCCCYCCYCRKKKSRKPDKSEEKAMREQEERRIRQEERRAEMKSRHDEIRKKYGLFKEENPYARFEN